MKCIREISWIEQSDRSIDLLKELVNYVVVENRVAARRWWASEDCVEVCEEQQLCLCRSRIQKVCSQKESKGGVVCLRDQKRVADYRVVVVDVERGVVVEITGGRSRVEELVADVGVKPKLTETARWEEARCSAINKERSCVSKAGRRSKW